MFMTDRNKEKRIVIFGNGCSGKTTLSKNINLPRYHLDEIYWSLRSFKHSPTGYYRKKHNDILKKDSWVIEGTPDLYFEKRQNRADLIIFLDTNRFVCIYRLIKRNIKNIIHKDTSSFCRPG